MTDAQIAAIMGWPDEHMSGDDPLSLLARVRALVDAVRADERERCSAIVQANADECQPGSVMYAILSANAAAIRST